MRRIITLKFVFVAVLLVSFSLLAGAYVASSSKYRLESDSLNFSGGMATSDNYKMENTVGESGTGFSSSTSVNLKAGYQAMRPDTFISISSSDDITLSPTINGVVGGESNGSSSWLVVTNNPIGYSLSVQASSSPALASGSYSFTDYVPSYSDPDFKWTIPANESRFGFSPKSVDLVAHYKDNGISCNSGSLQSVGACWNGLSTSAEVVSQSNVSNEVFGSATTLNFRAAVGSGKIQEQGNYVADIIVTAISL